MIWLDLFENYLMKFVSSDMISPGVTSLKLAFWDLNSSVDVGWWEAKIISILNLFKIY